jgi:hypothetical protein
VIKLNNLNDSKFPLFLLDKLVRTALKIKKIILSILFSENVFKKIITNGRTIKIRKNIGIETRRES